MDDALLSTTNRNTLLGLSAVLLWSVTVALGRSITERLGPLTAGCAVYLAAGLILSAHHFLAGRSRGRGLGPSSKYVIGCGALFLLYTTSLFLALGLAVDRRQTLEVGLLNYLWPSLTLLFSLFLLGNKAKPWLVPGTLLALSGVFLVMTQGTKVSWGSLSADFSGHPAAYGLGLLAAVSWALYSNLARRWGEPGGAGAVYLFTSTTGVAFLLIRAFHPERSAWSARVAVEVLALAVATAVAYVFWDMAMRGGNAVLVAASSYLTPFLSTLVSCAYLGVLPGARLWVGCALLIAGSFLSWLSVRPPQAEPAPPLNRLAGKHLR